MFSCRINDMMTTALSIVDPCNITIDLNREFKQLKSILPTPPHVATAIAVHIESCRSRDEPFTTRLSFNDLQLFLAIMATLSPSSDNAPDQVLALTPDAGDAVNENDVAVLQYMGFSRRESEDALRRCGTLPRSACWLCESNPTATAKPPPLPLEEDSSQRTPTALSPETVRDSIFSPIQPPQSTGDLTSPVSPAARSKLRSLEEMGFTPEDCRRSLEKAQGDVDVASMVLLDSASPLLPNAPPSFGVFSRVRANSDMSPSNVRSTGSSPALSDRSERSVATDSSGIEKFTHSLTLDVHSDGVSLCVIDDCGGHDLPLLELKVVRLKVNIKQTSSEHKSSLTGHFEGYVTMDFYNPLVSAWEPVLERWELRATLRSTAQHLTAALHAASALELNLTPILISSIRSTVTSWMDEYSVKGHRHQRERFVPYKITNGTGLPVHVTCIVGSTKSGFDLRDGEVKVRTIITVPSFLLFV